MNAIGKFAFLLFIFVISVGLIYFWTAYLLERFSLKRRINLLSFPITNNANGANSKHLLKKILQKTAPIATNQEDSKLSAIRIKLMHAGIRSMDAVNYFYGAKALLTISLSVVILFFLMLLSSNLSFIQISAIVLMASIFGYYVPNIWLANKVKMRQRELLESLPDAVDVMGICVEAGLGLDAAINRVASEISVQSENLSKELELLTLELRAGMLRRQAMENLGFRTGLEEVNMLVSMLIQTEKFGTSVGQSLQVFSEELRSKRALRAQESASKASTLMTVPMMVCIFPVILIIALGPAIINLSKALSGG